MDFIIRPAQAQDYPEILRLNEADVDMLSPMDEETLGRMAELVELFQVAEADGRIAGFLMVYRENSGYWSENYAWFCEHYPELLYVDRIVVAGEYRKYGLGQKFYEEVFRLAEGSGVPLVVAEIDIAPKYNAPSMAFHEKMGFHEVGTRLFKGTITVSLQVKELQDAEEYNGITNCY